MINYLWIIVYKDYSKITFSKIESKSRMSQSKQESNVWARLIEITCKVLARLIPFFAISIDLPSPIIASIVRLSLQRRSRQSSPQTPHRLQTSHEAQFLALLTQIKMKSAGLCQLAKSLIQLIFRCLPAGGKDWKVQCSSDHVRRDVAASVTLLFGALGMPL